MADGIILVRCDGGPGAGARAALHHGGQLSRRLPRLSACSAVRESKFASLEDCCHWKCRPSVLPVRTVESTQGTSNNPYFLPMNYFCP
jgi:hypothetical protein